jgi:pimeloyl-ACP methyl ester carboxylesterase
VPIAGGPGGASTEFYAGWAYAFEKIRRNRDILLLDQRGTGKSARMDCDFGDEIIEGQMSPEETIALTKSCIEALPYDPRFFTTSIAVLDLEALRQALGYTELNLYGSSYGTRVAQHFLRQFPDSTRTVILDGVAPPQIGLGPAIATEAQKALDNIFRRCAESRACNDRFPELETAFADLRKRLDDEPQQVSLANPLTGNADNYSFGSMEMAGAIRLLSYSPGTIALIPLLLNEAIEGNYAPLVAQFVMAAESMADALALGMHNSVVCTEDAPFFVGEAISREDLESTYIGPIMADALRDICSVWPAGIIDDGFKTPVATDKPVLLLSGDADPVTPPHFAELALVDMDNARHLIGRNQGHGLGIHGCLPDITAKFVESASVADLDDECLGRLHAMPFFLDFSGPAP